MFYCSVSNGEGTKIWSTAVFLIEKRQRYGVLQGFESSRDNNIFYCSVTNGEERAE
jgi:hypothetical protein